jgi:tRNA-binding protein
MQPAPVKPTVSFEQFEALDIRLGTIVAVDDVPGADKLVLLTVEFGDHRRQIVAGIKQEREDVQSVVGLQTAFVLNLEPRTIRGQLSEGMVLDVGYADGLLPAFLLPERRRPDGTRAG